MKIPCIAAAVLLQGSSTQLTGVGEVISSVSACSILCWHLWHDEVKTKPMFLEQIAQARRDFLEALAAEREARSDQQKK